MIAQAPIWDPNVANQYDKQFKQDRELVWEKLMTLLRGTVHWSHIQSTEKKRDGRKAFRLLKEHYLGKHSVDIMAAQAEHNLRNRTYRGEHRRWNMEKYITHHRSQHAIIDSLVDQGYAGMDQRSRVRHFIDNVKVPALDHLKAQVLSSDQLRQSFDDTVSLYKDYLANIVKSDDQGRVVSAVRSGLSDAEWEKVKPDMSVEDRFYKTPEYGELSPEEKKGLQIKRDKRKAESGEQDGPTPKRRRGGKRGRGKGKKTVRFAKKDRDATVSAIVSAVHSKLKKDIAVMMSSADDDDSSVESDNGEGQGQAQASGGNNRRNPALKRKNQ